jgi:hypothetical protein
LLDDIKQRIIMQDVHIYVEEKKEG